MNDKKKSVIKNRRNPGLKKTSNTNPRPDTRPLKTIKSETKAKPKSKQSKTKPVILPNPLPKKEKIQWLCKKVFPYYSADHYFSDGHRFCR
ncbi:hypothetical protein [Acetobacterium wieringae]|uniref:hypothetical protein n=1 Tax=Acetobacterium wieringae TaxID=52694 RepID=UPI0020344A03|nr:hypothetical protein [Acetobacterium wieringae]URN84656.1 hypothetical protein CHL1_000224 [Acetobacterium wieringae]